jgi:hypothetical protein
MTDQCFVVMPFGADGSKDKDHYDKVYEHIIVRALRGVGIECTRADRMVSNGEITTQVLERLRDSDLVIADLSGKNPNVFYELGYRHALNKPFIMVSDDPTRLPFNVRTWATVHYSLTDVPMADDAVAQIRKRASQAMEAARQREHPETEPEKEPAVGETLRGLRDTVEQGLDSIYRLMATSMPVQSTLDRELREHLAVLMDIQTSVQSVRETAVDLASASRLLQQTSELGLVNIYATRPEAIEEEFFDVMEREEDGIDIVGSTIFGAKGHHRVTHNMVVELLAQKKARHPNFVLRMLLTHPDFISHRQDQERTEKNIDRIVISRELRDAVEWLVQEGLAEHARFYRGAPTCFTLICRGEKRMLANPYPYQSEAYNSWTAIFRRTAKPGVYDQFGRHHFEEPYNNAELAVPFSEAIVEAVKRKLQEDLTKAQRDLRDAIQMDTR